MSEKEILNTYQERAGSFSRELIRMKQIGNLLSFGRLLIFILGIILAYFSSGIHYLLPIIVSFFFVGLFFLIVKKHGKNNIRQRHLIEMIKINENEIKAIAGDIACFNNGSEYITTDHHFSYDLDLFGDGSFFQFLNRTCSLGGKDTLKEWLNEPLRDKSEIKLRQDAVKELSTLLDWRQNFLASGNTYIETGNEEESIVSWTNQPPVFEDSRIVHIIRYLMPLLTGIVLILSIFRVLPASITLAMILFQLMIVAIYLVPLNQAHRQVTQRFAMLHKYAKLLSKIEKEEFSSRFLTTLKNRLTQEGKTAAYQINQLAEIIHRFDRRLDMILGVLLNGLFLWDIHCVVALDRWKRDSRIQIPSWFAVVNEFDVTISLASYFFNHPEYIFPEISGTQILIAEELGHPLIRKNDRITNDFQIKKSGSLVILTGPNMAGKSTFLRTVGINLVLGMAGAPVCATKFLFSPVKIYSSMRTSDSLQKNESYFYAELLRLKILKENLLQNEKIFILLDEILKGTNSQDKHVGSKLFIDQLIKMNGTGLIATHDVELGKLEKEYPEHIANKCFEVEIDGDQISFDYLLREGITQKMNAAYLMKQMGII